jgi:hypothetical protein
MAKTKISEFSATAANNTDIDSINIAEGCAPSGINDAIRELMAQLKDFQTGAVGDSFNGPVGTTTAAAGAFTTLSATGVTTVQAGTSSAPAITTSGDTNTGIFFPAADTIAFAEGGTEAMRIDSSGNLGLGVTPSAGVKLQLPNGELAGWAGTSGFLVSNTYYGSGDFRYVGTGTAARYQQTSGAHAWSTAASGTAGDAISFTQAMTLDASGRLLLGTTTAGSNQGLTVYNATQGEIRLQNSTTGNTAADGFQIAVSGSDALLYNRENANLIFGTNDTERARIDSSGNLLVGTTTVRATFTLRGSNAQYLCEMASSNAGANSFINFVVNDPSSRAQVGAITTNGTSTTYSTSSDYRLKNTIVPMTGALAKVAALKPVTYKWNADGSDSEGFIAHELAEVCPDAVTGEKDAINEDGSIKPQGIDTSFLVATLTAAIQEQQAIITALTARVEALESN